MQPGAGPGRFAPMSRAGTLFLTLATLAFVGSVLAHALLPALPQPGTQARTLAVLAYGAPETAVVDLSALLLQPREPALALLMLLACAALAYHALRCWIEDGASTRRRGHAPLIVGLLAGAAWPWLLRDQPTIALILAALMLAGFLVGALEGRQAAVPIECSSALGFAAGWALQVSFGLLATLLQGRLGIPPQAAAGLALLVGAVAAVSVQLRLGRRIGFSLALIWGLIGIAASTVASDATLATVTVLAIAIVAVALVRVTT